MRLIFERTQQGKGAERRYVLSAWLDVHSTERIRLDEVPPARWQHEFINHGIDYNALLEQGKYKAIFQDVWEAKTHERDIRAVFDSILTYLVAADGYGGNDLIEVDLNDLS